MGRKKTTREDELKGLLNCVAEEAVANLGLLAHLVEMDKKYNGGAYGVKQKGSYHNNLKGGMTRTKQR